MARIAVVSDLWPPFPGGAERMLFNIARELQNRGHKIFVLTSYANAAEFDGIKPTWIPLGVRAYDNEPGHGHADGLRDIENFLSECRANFILTHHFFAREFTELFYFNIPTIQVVHNGFRHPKATWAIFNSSYTRARGHAHTDDITMLPPAFEDIVAKNHGSHIGFIKPIAHKGINFLYQIADRMPEKNFMVLHGEWQNGEDIRRGLPNVFFMPPVHEMPTFYEKCRIMLVPSTQEDAGTVPQEAALNGIPCISSNVMGLAETNKGGIVLPLHLESWVSAIRNLDDSRNYDAVAQQQKAYIQSLKWSDQFDDLSRRICQLVGRSA